MQPALVGDRFSGVFLLLEATIESVIILVILESVTIVVATVGLVSISDPRFLFLLLVLFVLGIPFTVLFNVVIAI